MSTTKVILEGSMGKALGREWEFLNIRSARHALAMIDANTNKAYAWVRENIAKYQNYRVLIEHHDGRKEDIDTQAYTEMTQRGVKCIRFVPIIAGAGGVVKTVVGAVMMIVGGVTGQAWAIQMGAALALGGVAQLLSPKAKKTTQVEGERTTSHYFNGAVNPTNQGNPVQLVYGRCKVGSQAISAAMTVDQLL